MSLYPQSSRFWTSQANWYSSHLQAQLAARRGGLAPAERKAERWNTRGKHYLRNTGLKQHHLVRVDPQLSKDVLSMVQHVAPALSRAFDDNLAPLALRAAEQWPADTGLSRSMISLEYTARGSRFTGGIYARAPYTIFIRPPRLTEAERAKRKLKSAAIRAAAEAAGKADRLGSFQVTGGGSNKGAGRQVYKVLLDDKALGVGMAIGEQGLNALSRGPR